MKVIILFHSVSTAILQDEELYNKFEHFKIDLTLFYEFDHIELCTPEEVVNYLKLVHESID